MSVIAFDRPSEKGPETTRYGDLLTVNGVCELTGLSPQTVRRHVNSGVIPGSHIGRRIYIPKNAFISSIGGKACGC